MLRAGAAENEEEKLLQHYLLLMRRLRCNFKAIDIFGRPWAWRGHTDMVEENGDVLRLAGPQTMKVEADLAKRIIPFLGQGGTQ